jgi:hypothetical protein
VGPIRFCSCSFMGSSYHYPIFSFGFFLRPKKNIPKANHTPTHKNELATRPWGFPRRRSNPESGTNHERDAARTSELMREMKKVRYARQTLPDLLTHLQTTNRRKMMQDRIERKSKTDLRAIYAWSNLHHARRTRSVNGCRTNRHRILAPSRVRRLR